MSHRTSGVWAAAIGIALLTSGIYADAQQPASSGRDSSRWDVTRPRGATREIDFTTDQGTWMAVDPAPDGRWIYFDLLGQIYRVSAEGGSAECLTQESGIALNFQPRVSPDGRTIAFISDRSGQNNLWLMDADGAHPRAVFTDLNVRASEPAWTPDGRFLVVKREAIATPGRPAGGSGLWMYDRDGGQGTELVAAVGRTGPAWPSVSADGRYLYYQTSMADVTDDEPLSGAQQLRRLELATGQIVDLTAGESTGPASNRISSGGGVAPEISPDGRWLAFAREIPDGTISFKGHRYGPRTALWLRDLATGAERMLMDPIEPQSATGAEALGSLPRYRWASDGKSIVIPEGGRIRRVTVATGAVTTIPFTARVHRVISEMAYHPFRIDDGPMAVKFMRWQTASPDGRHIAFEAVGRIWIAEAGAPGSARRVTRATFDPLEYGPAWSPDGKWLAFTTWDDTARGQLWKVPATPCSGGCEPQRLSALPGEYIQPAWSPDGRSIIVVRGAGATAQGRTMMHNPWFDLVRVSSAPGRGGDSGRVVATIARPTGAPLSSESRRQLPRASFGPGNRIYFPEEASREQPGGRKENVVQLVSVAPDGNDRRVHLVFPYADEIVPSPDGRWVAFQEGDNVYLTPVAMTGGTPMRIDKRKGQFVVRQLTLAGGLFPRWRDSTTVEYGSGNSYYAFHVNSGTADTVALSLSVPRAIPTGTVALTNARLVTLDHRKVIERGTIVVRGGRITCVDEVARCSTAGADRVLDLAGATVIPGWVDMHSHHYREHRGMRPRRDYEAAIYLAYGVTTSMDVSMWSQNIFPTAELIEAGETIGPRTFSTGDPLYRGDAARQNELSSFAVADENVARLADWGATAIKQYMQPRRDQRQWVSESARRRGLNVTAEGGDLLYDVSMIMDGQTGWEHPVGVVPLYADATRFFGLAHATYSPTLVVAGPGAWNIEYWYQSSDVWKDPKQRLWFPWRMLIPHTRVRTLRPQTDYSYPLIAQGMADVIAAGGHGALGSHGEHHGLNAHWEVWMGASALGNMGALEVASLDGAHFLGADRDLGSLEVGKLADLMVLNSNPLDDIRNTLDMRFVMKGGRLYDAMTLDEVWPRKVPFGPRPWLNADELRSDDRPMDVWDHPASPPHGASQ